MSLLDIVLIVVIVLFFILTLYLLVQIGTVVVAYNKAYVTSQDGAQKYKEIYEAYGILRQEFVSNLDMRKQLTEAFEQIMDENELLRKKLEILDKTE